MRINCTIAIIIIFFVKGMFSLAEDHVHFSPFEEIEISNSAIDNIDNIDNLWEAQDLLSELSEVNEADIPESDSTPVILTDDEGDNENYEIPNECPPTPVGSLELGYMGQTLEGLERGVVGFSSYMRSAMNYVGLSPTDSEIAQQSTEQSEKFIDKKVIAEFKVIQTNWYYRRKCINVNFIDFVSFTQIFLHRTNKNTKIFSKMFS